MAGALDLLSLLGGSSSSDLLSLLGGKTDASADQVKDTLTSALPSMLSKLQSNASTKEGAESLLNALNQHDLDELDIVKLIKNADEEDGVKILNHIYGSADDTAKAAKEVASKSGLDASQVTKLMATAAPALLSTLAGVNKKANNSSAVTNSDGLSSLLGSVLSLAGGGSSSTSGLLGSILGAVTGSNKQDDGIDVASILGSLLK